MRQRDICHERIREFESYQTGWDNGDEQPFSADVIKASLTLNNVLRDLSLTRRNAFPSPDGTILLVVYGNEQDLEITVETDGTFSMARMDAATNQELSFEEDIDGMLAISKIFDFRRDSLRSNAWNSFESLTLPNIGIHNVVSSGALPSSQARETRESQPSYENQWLIPNVSTATATTLQFLGTPRSYSSSEFQIFQLVG